MVLAIFTWVDKITPGYFYRWKLRSMLLRRFSIIKKKLKVKRVLITPKPKGIFLILWKLWWLYDNRPKLKRVFFPWYFSQKSRVYSSLPKTPTIQNPRKNLERDRRLPPLKPQPWVDLEESSKEIGPRSKSLSQRKSPASSSPRSRSPSPFCPPPTRSENGTTPAASSETTDPSASFRTPISSAFALALRRLSSARRFRSRIMTRISIPSIAAAISRVMVGNL